MKINDLHRFDVSREQMIEIQQRLRADVRLCPLVREPYILSGFDISYGKEFAVAVLATFDSDWNVLELVTHVDRPSFEYVPGLLSFRELPFFLEVWGKATIEPDVVCFDGNGVMHERGVGEATHASFFIDTPTIGVAKTYYFGEYETVGASVGSYSPIVHNDAIVGAAVRTMKKANPIFVSVGNAITLQESVDLVLKHTAKQSKLCEMTRYADMYSRKLLSEYGLV